MTRHVRAAGRMISGWFSGAPPNATPEGYGAHWFRLISSVNRSCLLNAGPEAKRAGVSIRSLLRRRSSRRAAIPNWIADYTWKGALNALGAECVYRVTACEPDLHALSRYFDRVIDPCGSWTMPIARVDDAMKGYSLLYLAQVDPDARYRIAAEDLANAFVRRHARAPDGSLVYDVGSAVLLVDTLAMICPFLARCSVHFDSPECAQVSLNQLLQFVRRNVDPDTSLPYHGYYADGPARLGLHGWGRGTGWYMMGLVDTLAELATEAESNAELIEAFVRAAHSLRVLQREDGHWSWAIPQRGEWPDASATSLIGYSLVRGVQLGMLDHSFEPVILAALAALARATNANGVLDGAQGECLGLGRYPWDFGPRPWLQGSATALAALSLSYLEAGDGPRPQAQR